ncbi:cell wall-associated NlpC family hydrolase [Rhizobium petrolearium]|uniref:hypothetical protein n=1 Tax=Neorhizobium petrolearium TaxID=515361 RepID=UPI001AE10546|nr:hypothetical protein [Neorhizobium petrolearium]MBP1848261.1 cell wall-associated NlpC family hydrolase [Neorhizobium petrolearium]
MATDNYKAVSKFKLANLMPGDILFSTDPEGRESKAIRTATGSPFSHAAIYRGELNFLEAADYGVINFNYFRFGITSKSNVAVYRLRPTEEAEALAAKASTAVEKYRQLDYWTPGAVMSAFKMLRRLGARTGLWLPAREKGFFCSYLVSQSYDDVGLELCPGLRPHEIHPGDLLKSPYLEDVSHKTIVDLPSWDTRVDVLDGHSRDSPFQRYTAARRHILTDIQKLMADFGLAKPATLDDVLQIIMLDEDAERQMSVDGKVSKQLEKSGFAALTLAYTSNIEGDEAGTINGVAYSELRLDVLKATIANYEFLKQKWEIRLGDVEGERAAGTALRENIPLEILGVWDRHLENLGTALENALCLLEVTVKHLNAELSKREA